MKIREYKIINDKLNCPKLWVSHTYDYKGNDIKSYDKITNMLNECFKLNRVVDEHSYVIAFTASLDFLGVCELGHGDSFNTPSNFKCLFKFLLLINADRFIVVHNHPDGGFIPSDGDKITTKKLLDISNTLSFVMDESILVARDKYTLIKEIVDKEIFDSLPTF